MAAIAGFLNHSLTAAPTLSAGGATPTDSSTSGSGSSDTATISANDFLTLLVTEMQNQDPTADTDPNEYINQLVQVNSLEQLISINQTLTTDLGSTSTTPPSNAPAGQTGATASAHGPTGAAQSSKPSAAANGVAASGAPAISSATPLRGSPTAAAIQQFAQSVGARKTSGNLAIPSAKPASHRLAHALDGHARAPAPAVKLP